MHKRLHGLGCCVTQLLVTRDKTPLLFIKKKKKPLGFIKERKRKMELGVYLSLRFFLSSLFYFWMWSLISPSLSIFFTTPSTHMIKSKLINQALEIQI